MSQHVEHAEVASLQRERDLYLRLLNRAVQKELMPFLRAALALSVEAAETGHGCAELPDDADESDPPRWWIAHDLSADEVCGVRAALSRT